VVSFALVSTALAADALDTNDGGMTELSPVDVFLPAGNPAHFGSPLGREPSATTTIVDAKDRGPEATDASQLVAASPGAAVQDQGGLGQRKTVSLRGAAPNAVMVLLDGVPLNGPGNAVDLSRLPVALLDRVEVMRGPGSRYGPGAMGGVVNLVTRAPQGTRAFAEVTLGSFWTGSLSAGASTKLLGGEGLAVLHGFSTMGDFTYQYDDKPALADNPWAEAIRKNNHAQQGGGLLRFGRQVGGSRVDVVAEGFFESRVLAGPAQNPSLDASQLSGRGTLSARLTSTFAWDASVEVLAYARVDTTALRGGPFSPNPYRQLETSAGAEILYSQRAFQRHRFFGLLSGGADGLREPTERHPAWGRFGALVGDEVSFFDGRMMVDASVRTDVAGPYVVVSPKASTTVFLPAGFEIRASAGQASRPPGFQELYVRQGTVLPNPDLKPERGLLADATVGLKRSKGLLQVTGFYGLYENLIAYEYYPPTLARPYNFAAALSSGVEVEGALTLAPWFEAQGSYTFLVTQNLKDDPRYYLKALPYRPAHRATVRVVGGWEWLQFRADALAQSHQFINRTEAVSLPARVFLNMGIASTPWKNPRVTVSLNVRNLLDVQTQDLDGYPLPSRSVFLSVSLVWGTEQVTGGGR
jgi:iron complex outermembrane receptor protein